MNFLIFIYILMISLNGSISQKLDLDVDALLADIFNTSVTDNNSPSSPTPPSQLTTTPSTVNNQEEDCVCVPYYQCSGTIIENNRTILENGEDLINISITQDLCGSYLDVCCKLGDTSTTSPTPSPTPYAAGSVCGQRKASGISLLRITGALDNEAQFGEFPWMMAITTQQQVVGSNNTVSLYQCGGSLISPSVVLTIAHCVYNKTGLSVRGGEWDTQTDKEPLPAQMSGVREVIIHEQFNINNLDNDIALLLLETPMMLAPNVGTICLPEQEENMDGRQCVASGWGKDSFGKEGGVEGKDTCKGDGGSPLACPSSTDSQTYVQSGIVSWGIGCGSETPGVYVNVAHFRNWIDLKMSSLNLTN